jgi:hypothetical protein
LLGKFLLHLLVLLPYLKKFLLVPLPLLAEFISKLAIFLF